MADKLQSFNVLSYLSSTILACSAKKATTPPILLLAPGAVQIFYGDESNRPFGPTGSDPLQGTRSQMNWQDIAANPPPPCTLAETRQFRARHSAVGSGKQTTLALPQGYGFVRENAQDKVMVVWAGHRNLSFPQTSQGAGLSG
ncbi:hypothetical protein ACNKHO_22730 [Shigella flexneri]